VKHDTAAGVAVKVFVEQDVIAEVRIGLHPRMVGKLRPPAVLIGEEDPGQRVATSLAASFRVTKLPDPVGHSTLKSSP